MGEIKLNERQTKSMLKIRGILEDCYENGNLRKYKLTQMILEDVLICYQNICRTHEHSYFTICKDTADLFKRSGFRVSEMEGASGAYEITILTEAQQKSID